MSAALAAPANEPSRSFRRSSPDALRGLIMAFMALDHASFFIAHRHSAEFWSGEITRYEAALPFLTRFVTHFCAPGFFFLMGCGMAWFASSRRAAGWTSGRVARFFLVRGLLLVLANQLVENPAWLLGALTQGSATPPPAPGAGGPTFLLTGVLTALGLTLMLGGVLIGLRSGLWIALGLAALWITNAWMPDASQAGVAFSPLLRLLLIPGRTGILLVLYPLIPWFAIGAFGVVFGRWLERNERTASRAAPWIGVALVLAACGLRAAGGFGNLRLPRDEGWIEFLNFVKYPPALVFSCFMVGGNLVLFGWLEAGREAVRGLLEVLAVFGRVPFFFYLAHLWLFAIVGALFFGKGISLPAMYAVWLAGIVALWWPCRAFRSFKERRPAESAWRLF